ncbi:hypothetical protein O181_038357 [Austropuccinia psidii MF-1]|uniref:Protein-serine/threonine kinase n=1 Tax=Austropuccinia psidii MF-1 TaxID=1389203 RepID=A0A9Q3HBT7_9BASI|nr:hypothetical protein [Austropuccinia psidii MF-1]
MMKWYSKCHSILTLARQNPIKQHHQQFRVGQLFKFIHSSNSATSSSKVTLDRLMRFGPRPLKPSYLLESAELTRIELSERLKKRVNAHLSLPFLPASNPHIKKVMSIYHQSLQVVDRLPPIRSTEENSELTKVLETMIDDAQDVIGLFAQGFQESKRYLPQEKIDSFLDRAIHSRISLRLIAEQHLTLSKPTQELDPTKIGIVDQQLQVKKVLDSVLNFVDELCQATYDISPEWLIDGQVDAKICFIDLHLQYILLEVLKNAFRATVEHHRNVTKLSHPSLPPIQITLAIQNPPQTKSSNSEGPLETNLSKNNGHPLSNLFIRIRDCGGGIDPIDLSKVFSYAFTTVGQSPSQDDIMSPPSDLARISFNWDHNDELKCGLGRLAGLGFGLPMARLYCRYFDGNLELVNMHGLGGGVDSYITLGVRS